MLLEEILDALDPRVRDDVRREALEASAAVYPQGLWVLCGHRSAGKTRLLPVFSSLTGLPAVDLDARIAQSHGRDLKTWIQTDEVSFRAAERATFLDVARDPRQVVAVGGGFLALHGPCLLGHTAVLVPVSFETYRERLLADTTRPRLRPELSLDEELREVFQTRQATHAAAATVSLGRALGWLFRRSRTGP